MWTVAVGVAGVAVAVGVGGVAVGVGGVAVGVVVSLLSFSLPYLYLFVQTDLTI